MLKQYFKIALRSLRKNKFYALVNIFGLAVGITTFILISLFIHFHLSYDRFHENYKRIYRIDRIEHLADRTARGNETWFPIARTLKQAFPEIEEALVCRHVDGAYLSSTKDRTFFEDDGLYAEKSFFDIFSFELVEGDPETALNETFSMIMTERHAKKYFPEGSAMGKIIHMRDKGEFRITGILRNMPENTEFDDLDFIIPMKALNHFRNNTLDNDWGYINFQSFIMLRENTQIANLEAKYTQELQEYIEDTRDEICLTKLTDLHLFGYEDDKTHILLIVYGMLAIFSLIVACINFINLSTALSTTRAKEIGIKKVVGSYRSSLIKQFLTESILITFMGLLLAFLLTVLFLPVFSQVVLEPLTFTLSNHWKFILAISIVILTTGIFSGLYPAFVLSSFNAVKAIKNPFGMGGKKAKTRKALVAFQFVLTSMIIFSTIMILGQFRFMRDKPRGFNSENVLVSQLQGEKNLSSKDCQVLYSEIKRIPGVKDIATSGYLPYRGYRSWPANWEGSKPDEKINIRRNWIGYNYFSLYKVELLKGRFFSENPENENQSCIINETAANTFGWDDPIGKRIDNDQYQVIGVVKDFHVNSVFNKIPPCLFLPKKESLAENNVFSIKINEGIKAKELKTQIADVFEKYVPDQIIEVRNYDELVHDGNIRVYNSIVKTFSFFAAVTILLSLFGLFGLVSFSLKRRTKEVGIRKSLGSRVIEIFVLLAKDFAGIIVIGLIMGLPASLIFNLIDPAYYKPPLNWFHMILGFIGIIVVAFASVGYHTFRASVVNPVKALRYE